MSKEDLMKSILLTGGNGFIGSNLKNYLSSDFKLIAPSSSELNLLDAKLVCKFFCKNEINFIIHAASVGVNRKKDEQDILEKNLIMFDNLAQYISDDCKMIFLGSGAEYDKSRDIVNIKEDDFGKNIPSDPYGYSKYVISQKIKHIDNIVNLRLFGVFGFGEKPQRVITSIIDSNLQHNNIILNQNVKYSFIYIKDLCRIIRHFIYYFPQNKFINTVSCKNIEIMELAKIVNELSKYKSTIILNKTGLNREYTADNSLLLSLIDNFKFTSYEIAIKEMIFQHIMSTLYSNEH